MTVEPSSNDLRPYIDTAEKIADSIAAILRLDVTIMDKSFHRIAGTGAYRQLIGQRIEYGTAFDYCQYTGKPQVVERALDHPLCANCPQNKTCNEIAEICVPIRYGESTIGVIGIIAFSMSQKDFFMAEKESYLDFLQKMSGLLSAKYAEIVMGIRNQHMAKRLDTIIAMMNEALLVYDGDGQILYQNEALERLLHEVGFQSLDKFAGLLWEHPTVSRFRRSKIRNQELEELIVEDHQQHFSFMTSLQSLQHMTDSGEIIITLQNFKKIEKKMIQASVGSELSFSFDDILGQSEAIAAAKDIARQAAMSDSSVLILGESGTGKELFARAIHNSSKRRDKPFVAINCSAIPNELLESELYGHEKGAFTGAVRTKLGKFEVADHGTLFLDEIGDMPYHMQSKLLRVLQDQRICRIGSNHERKVDIRIISATNQDLSKKIADGTFRQDLYYRINIIPLNIPPLRARNQDIAELAEYFLRHYANIFQRPLARLPEDTKKLLLGYTWPGNVRELQNVMEYAVGQGHGGLIDTTLIATRLELQPKQPAIQPPIFPSCEDTSLTAYLQQREKEYLQLAIDDWRSGSRSLQDVCRALGISRATLYRKLREHHIYTEPESTHRVYK